MKRENDLKQPKPQLVNQFSGCASPEWKSSGGAHEKSQFIFCLWEIVSDEH